jgi:hypothetical protein
MADEQIDGQLLLSEDAHLVYANRSLAAWWGTTRKISSDGPSPSYDVENDRSA